MVHYKNRSKGWSPRMMYGPHLRSVQPSLLLTQSASLVRTRLRNLAIPWSKFCLCYLPPPKTRDRKWTIFRRSLSRKWKSNQNINNQNNTNDNSNNNNSNSRNNININALLMLPMKTKNISKISLSRWDNPTMAWSNSWYLGQMGIVLSYFTYWQIALIWEW